MTKSSERHSRELEFSAKGSKVKADFSTFIGKQIHQEGKTKMKMEGSS